MKLDERGAGTVLKLIARRRIQLPTMGLINKRAEWQQIDRNGAEKQDYIYMCVCNVGLDAVTPKLHPHRSDYRTKLS